MPRPKKCRYVTIDPYITYFKPAGIPLRKLTDIKLDLDELEALKLKDLGCLEQYACACEMRISRSTFQRLLVSARRKIAEALIEGKAIRIKK